jgi:hypothetical protein
VLAVAIAAVVYTGLTRWRWPVIACVAAAGIIGVIAQSLIRIVA